MGDRGSRPPSPEKSQKYSFCSNTDPDPLKNRNYQASIQCWVIIGTPAKRHLMALRWRADDGPLICELGSSLSSSTKKKRCHSWSPSAHAFAAFLTKNHTLSIIHFKVKMQSAYGHCSLSTRQPKRHQIEMIMVILNPYFTSILCVSEWLCMYKSAQTFGFD